MYVIIIAILGTFLIKELIIDIKLTAPPTNDDVISTVYKQQHLGFIEA